MVAILGLFLGTAPTCKKFLRLKNFDRKVNEEGLQKVTHLYYTSNQHLKISDMQNMSTTAIRSTTAIKCQMQSKILCLIDFDDTLLPSSHLQDLMDEKKNELEMRKRTQRKRNHYSTSYSDEGGDNGDENVYKHNGKNKENEVNSLLADEQQTFRYLENAAITLLAEVCKRSSRVVIISNAEIRWITYTLSHFFPRLGDIIQRNKVVILSARDEYNSGAQFEKPLQWKVHAFRSCAASFAQEASNSGNNFHILSIGDSDHERKAAKIASLEHGASMRTIKLLEAPSLALLHKQLDYLCQHIDIFASDLCVGGKQQVELLLGKNGREVSHEVADTSIGRSKFWLISQ